MNLAICTCNFHFFHKGIFDTNENALIILISSKNYPINQILLKIFITNRTSFFLFGYSFAKIIFSIDSNRFFYDKQIHAIPEINPAFKISTTRKRQVADNCSERNNIILAEIPCAARDESRTWKSTRLVSKNVRNFGNNPQWISSIRPVAVRRMWRMAAKLSDPGSMPLEPTWLDFVLHFLPLSLSLFHFPWIRDSSSRINASLWPEKWFHVSKPAADGERIPQRGWIAIVKCTLRETRLGRVAVTEKRLALAI